MSRHLQVYQYLPKITYRDDQERITSIEHTLNAMVEIKYSCNTGYDFRDMWNDYVRHRITLMGGVNDDKFQYR